MTEITQADRDAAAEAFCCKPLRSEKHNDDRRVQAFARHRLAERARIVAWLRKEAIMSTDTVRRRMNEALDQVETGEHLK